ncbi:hypothetical protein [Streptomyces sp. NPDC093109]|uniref:hypothetical protein n=1 Tax=Streptomyces sp. NPDC093109 TaxID=3154977 RepID=UPI00344B556C
MTVSFLISKYDEARRAGEVDDWTSHGDIGRSFDGRVLTVEEYLRTEDLYASAVAALADAVGADGFEMRNIILNEPAPPWLGSVYDGKVIDVATTLRLVREMLRHGSISCSLEYGDLLSIAVETDFYLSADIDSEAVGSLARVERLGLHTVRVQSWRYDDEWTALVSRPADHGFWEEVAAGIDRVPSMAVVLERWAQGRYGYRWHLVENGDLAPVAASVVPQSLVTVFFSPEIQWVARGDLHQAVGSAMDDSLVVIFSRPIAGVEGGALRTITCGEGVPIPDASELPPGGELGVFTWPDEDASPYRAVVPGPGGEIVARWEEPTRI